MTPFIHLYCVIWIELLTGCCTTTGRELPTGQNVVSVAPIEVPDESMYPRFAEPIPNVTVTVGRDALLACVVDNLRGFKVAWVRMDTQTILSIHHNIITQNARISLSYNDHRSWYLHIKNVQEVDRGWYMCQVNTDPMRSRKGYLQVVGEYATSISLSYNDHRSWYLHIKNVQEVDRGWYMCQVNTDPMRSRKGYLQVVGEYATSISLSYNDHRSWYLHIKNVQEVDRGWYMCQVNTDPMRSRKGYLQVVGEYATSISLSYNDHRSWYLHIKNVQEVDRGWYMCQVNTDPMRSRKGYLQVVGEYATSISLSYNDHRSWYLHIKNVQEVDRGWYMCQVNTDPMRSRKGYLQVVGEYATSISLSYNDHRSWYLHIKNVQEVDRGWYMCQVNTDPMRSRKGYLQVVVPPSIIDNMTSTDMVVREGSDVTLVCRASGYPEPYVMWRREDGQDFNYNGESVSVVDGETLTITKVSRLHMGAYLCIASNGVPPSISKRIMLMVQFPPMLSIPNQLEGAYIGQDVTLECHTEAYPSSINYWTTDRGDMIISGGKYEAFPMDSGYNKFMMLKIKNITKEDFGFYKCIAKNSLGETDGIIKLDEIPAPPSAFTTTQKSVLDNQTIRKKGLPQIIQSSDAISSNFQGEMYGEQLSDFDDDLENSASLSRVNSILGYKLIFHVINMVRYILHS
ncbi:hypothetical protein PYW07_016568 [Mythimna separata]|uniref:Ig-like domain-containing protein n=1 Tax=Mythimna separata TaxID=271217 RepID=A0AAD8DRY5_MYTSE|nr:hypothetical protein PYW07_016568 [Mythimna separata]